MNTGRPQIDEIYFEAANLAGPERNDYLNRVCEGNPSLRRQVEKLLRAQPKAEQFLEAGVTVEALPIADENVGATIGPYKLREQIGEGGFGIVYVAEQEKLVARKVALKIIRPGMDSRDVIARFEAERQALALMDHPNVAKVLDAGATESGRPYFVMELVKGVPITEFCDAQKLTTRERLELFIDVCRAVQHAHQKGIIHRDLKPSNVMVTVSDGWPMAKVIDFGISKALSQKLTEKTVYTAYGQMVGTPLYMSPEQAALSMDDVDTRSDVYSLGVLLYELLTGTTPFEKETLKTAGFDEFRRLLRDVDPPRPSARLSTLNAEALSTVSANRRFDPRKLSHHLRGELDWIVMQALEKDRTRRYESASAFAADVQRYLDDQPVQACPPSIAYRLRKYARRHKGLLTTLMLLAMTLLAATTVSLRYAFQADRARDVAQQETQNAIKARRLADKRLKQSRADFDRALRSLDTIVSEVSSVEFAQIPEVAPVRDEIVGKALAFYQKIINEHDNDPYARQQQAQAYMRIANMHHLARRFSESMSLADRGVSILEDLLREKPGDLALTRQLVHALYVRCPLGARPRKDCLADAERALALSRKLVREGNIDQVAMLGKLHLKVAVLLPDDSPRIDELLVEAIRIPRAHGIDPDATVYLSQAKRAHARGDLDAAEEAYLRGIELQEHLGLGHRRGRGALRKFYLSYAQLLQSMGRFADAERLFLKSIDIGTSLYKKYGRLHVYAMFLQDSCGSYINFLDSRGRTDEANEALDLLFKELPQFAESTVWRPRLARRLDNDDEALAFYNRLLERHPRTAYAYPERAAVYRAHKQWDMSLRDINRALELDPGNAAWYIDRAQTYIEMSHFNAALADFKKAVELDDSWKGYNSVAWYAARYPVNSLALQQRAVQWAHKAIKLAPNAASSWNTLGVAQYRAGNLGEAIQSLQISIELAQGGSAFDYFFLALAHAQLSHKGEARRWYDKAIAWTDENKANDEELARFRTEAQQLIGPVKPSKPKLNRPPPPPFPEPAHN